ncbi:hypothetical protein MSG28_002015 [Choristoneura fumiferana]|uniref:Uncharacterized protein n=1 Tax=Choristoneura fumiferana TaxID=7141 RepID=A0ACC0JTI9_CHOFU|nr:hypothetical protein MSG28_002015 [Choristoneura fumiferana]
MDETVLLLRKWSISEEIIKNFLDNDISIENFKDLTDTYLKELCPHIGQRIILRNNIQDLLESVATTEALSENTVYTNHESHSSARTNKEVSGDSFSSLPILDDITNILEDINRPPLPDFDINTLLQTSAHGSSILNYYKRYQCLNAKKRNILVDIIIKHIYTYIVNNKLRAEDYNLIAARIVSLFPSENIGTYFMRAVPTAKSISGKYIPAKGKLVDKVRNLLYISGEKHRRPKSTQRIPENELENEPKNLSLMIDAAHDDDCLWLKNNNEPWDEVVLRWKKTRKYRIGQEHIFPTIHDFLENWPILKDAKGHVLINLDFEEMYEEQSLNFFKNWHFFFEKLLKLKQDQIKNETGLSLLETLFALKDDDTQWSSKL